MSANPLVGTYRLLRWENLDQSGAVSYPLGADALGFISYTEDGHVFVHIMAADRRNLSGRDLFGGTDEEIQAAAHSHISYCGGYRLESDHVVHSVEVCSYPNWVGTEQRRRYCFIDGNLQLSAAAIQVGDSQFEARLLWQPLSGTAPGDRKTSKSI